MLIRTALRLGSLLLMLSGYALPAFENPASSPKTSIDDADLYGQWVALRTKEDGTTERETETLLIGRHPKRDGWMRAGGQYLNNDNELKNEIRNFLATRIGEDHFISLPLTKKDRGNDAENFMLARYQFDKKARQLRLWWVDPRKLKDAVEKGLLLGTITETPVEVDGKEQLQLKAVHVESSTDQIRAFLKQHPEMIFQSKHQTLEKFPTKS